MSNVAGLIADFKFDNNLSTQISDTNAMLLVNRWFRDVINFIKAEVDEFYFYDVFTPKNWYWLLTDQNEYTLPKRTETEPWLNKVKVVSIKYRNTDTDYIKLVPWNLHNLEKDLDWYKTNTPDTEWQAFYLIMENSLFIYPSPKEDVADWIKLYWIKDPIDLKITDEEADIPLPLEVQYLVPLAMTYHYWKSLKRINEKNDALNEYNNAKIEAKWILTNRIDTPLESEMPYIANLW